MTATPHNGKEEDFQLFLSLLDSDRFYGKFRDGVHKVDTSDLMRRMVKEELVKFDGTPLFPERKAYTVNYKLSDIEAALYEAVTHYVKTEMGKADRLGGQRKGSVGFALTSLQRRLASSPEAIFQSLKRRRERLQRRLREENIASRGGQILAETLAPAPPPSDFNGDGLASQELPEVPEDDDDLNARSRRHWKNRSWTGRRQPRPLPNWRMKLKPSFGWKIRPKKSSRPVRIANGKNFPESSSATNTCTTPEAVCAKLSFSASTATRSIISMRKLPACSAVTTPSSPFTAARIATNAASAGAFPFRPRNSRAGCHRRRR